MRGVSSRAILEALIVGETDPTALAELARGRMRTKRDLLARAVAGRFTRHHAFLISEQLGHLDYLEEAMERVSDEIGRRLQEEQAAVELLDTVPGISRRGAEILLAEIGTDLGRFPSAKHLASCYIQLLQMEFVAGAHARPGTNINPSPPPAGFNTYYGEGTGRYNGKPNASIIWTFTDAGEPGGDDTLDTADITILDASGTLVLTVSGALDKGNHQAHDR